MRLNLGWIPKECNYCNKPVACQVVSCKFLGLTRTWVCKECAKKIWNEETNMRLP